MKLTSSRQRRKNDHCQWVIVETPSARSAIFPPLHHFLPFPPVDRGRINATAITIVSFRTESIDALGGMLRIVRRFSVNLNNEQQTKLLALVVKISSDKQFRENEKKKKKRKEKRCRKTTESTSVCVQLKVIFSILCTNFFILIVLVLDVINLFFQFVEISKL